MEIGYNSVSQTRPFHIIFSVEDMYLKHTDDPEVGILGMHKYGEHRNNFMLWDAFMEFLLCYYVYIFAANKWTKYPTKQLLAFMNICKLKFRARVAIGALTR